MFYRLEIQKILLQIQEYVQDSKDCIALLKQAIHLADKHGDINWGIDLRIMLIREERCSSACIESPLAFAWLLEQARLHPDLLSEVEFLEEYEWMICSAYGNVAISLDQVHAIAADLEEKLEQFKVSKRSFYYTMAGFAQHLGDYNLGAAYVAKAREEALSEDCSEAMAYDNEIESAARLGHFDQAIALMHQMEYKKIRDFSLPFETYISMGYFMMRYGDERARIYIDKAKEEFVKLPEVNSSLLYGLTRLIYALHLIEDEDRWGYYEIVAGWDIDAEDDLKLMLSRHMMFVLDQEEKKQLTLSPSVPFYQESGFYDLKVLALAYRKSAYDWAKRFDLRNGNTFAQDDLTRMEEENKRKKML
ncbi:MULTISPECIES: hypothetical protein [unclassified Myroides]|uniref:hypothetical protein n=1 Tax=unclassified Myroides TaxID=2642485 RepID=UPI003D2F974D